MREKYETTGGQWRNLPHDFPAAFTVHSFYRRARLRGLWDIILEHLVKITRERAGRNPEPRVHSATLHDTKSGIYPAICAYLKYPTIKGYCAIQ